MTWLDKTDDLLKKAKKKGREFKVQAEGKELNLQGDRGRSMQEGDRILRSFVLPRFRQLETRCEETHLPCNIATQKIPGGPQGDLILMKIGIDIEGLGGLRFESDLDQEQICIKEDIRNPRTSSPLGEAIPHEFSISFKDMNEARVEQILVDFLEHSLGTE